MVKPTNHVPARFTLRVDDDVLPAVPVSLTGQDAALVLERAPRLSHRVRLVLDWHAGGQTELAASVRAVAGDGRLTHLDVHAVGGDWRPFLAWLGTQSTS